MWQATLGFTGKVVTSSSIFKRIIDDSYGSFNSYCKDGSNFNFIILASDIIKPHWQEQDNSS